MIEAVSCGGVVIYRGKILTLYKSYKNKYDGYVAGSQFRERAGRMGVFNMGRNVVMKAVVPLVFETKK